MMTKTYKSAVLIFLAVFTLTTACTKDSEFSDVKQVRTLRIKDPEVTILQSQTHRFDVYAGDTPLAHDSFDWTSSDEKVAYLSYDAFVRGSSTGTARIKATTRTNGFMIFGIPAGTSVEATVTVKPFNW